MCEEGWGVAASHAAGAWGNCETIGFGLSNHTFGLAICMVLQGEISGIGKCL